jgi:hypothetical protein
MIDNQSIDYQNCRLQHDTNKEQEARVVILWGSGRDIQGQICGPFFFCKSTKNYWIFPGDFIMWSL